MKQVESISTAELRAMAEQMFGNLVKAVVDANTGQLVLDVDMHADAEAYLLETGSKQENLWGINLKTEHVGTDEFVEFDSMINIRPRQNNPSRGVEDEALRKKIRSIVAQKVTT